MSNAHKRFLLNHFGKYDYAAEAAIEDSLGMKLPSSLTDYLKIENGGIAQGVNDNELCYKIFGVENVTNSLLKGNSSKKSLMKGALVIGEFNYKTPITINISSGHYLIGTHTHGNSLHDFLASNCARFDYSMSLSEAMFDLNYKRIDEEIDRYGGVDNLYIEESGQRISLMDYAIHWAKEPMIIHLVEAGANLDGILHKILRSNNMSLWLMNELIERGANPEDRDKNGDKIHETQSPWAASVSKLLKNRGLSP